MFSAIMANEELGVRAGRALVLQFHHNPTYVLGLPCLGAILRTGRTAAKEISLSSLKLTSEYIIDTIKK